MIHHNMCISYSSQVPFAWKRRNKSQDLLLLRVGEPTCKASASLRAMGSAGGVSCRLLAKLEGLWRLEIFPRGNSCKLE
ncbi:hypothetical protein BRARA_H01239 [Brassica rapa]|uniref:Uncharacterized protein n=1 Tax=Brassica campestris TaxID=3711 RepID=A0A397YKQ9_BRACM|nr:hypothetical protein BRARA_H01239 [Brassica rapa]